MRSFFIIFCCDGDILKCAEHLAQFFKLLLMADSAKQFLPNDPHQLRAAFAYQFF